MNANSNKAAMLAVFTERYVLSLVFLCSAWFEFHILWIGWPNQPGTENAAFVEIGRHVNRLMMDLFIGSLLLLGRRVAVPPRKLKNILVPLATTFFYLMYDTVPWFPASLQKSLCPAGWQVPLAVAGLVLGVIIGPVVAMWGILYLGRSFGIFVMVRKVVLGGPYHWVRHPMYLGWICICAGLVLTNFSGACFILVAIHIFLLVYRARLEEAQLAEYSPEYREYMKRTGFIFPRLRRARL
jgi:protein-S-isoprenylcysteine O-methyltransferase Ste14